MIAIDNTIVSEHLLDKKFVCDLQACKGACCVQGDSGAPIDKEEIPILKAVYEKVKPFMIPEGIATIEKHGFCVVDEDGDDTIPLLDGKGQCAFVYYDEEKIAKCAIEKAHKEGKIDFKKPISCHLYPVRITKYKDYDAVNYHKWSVCKPACDCGKKLSVSVYQFLKAPLIRKYGEKWYDQLTLADKLRSIGN